jgi:competence protein ComEC
MRKALLLMAAFAGLSGVVCAQGQKPLDIYFIDVEGGQSTLFVSPSGESMLIDTGNPGDRDAGRIADVAKQAGLKQLDYVLITHYDADHVGGAKDVGERIPIRNFVDHGARLPSSAFGAPAGTPLSPQAQANNEKIDKSYEEARAKGKHLEVKPGDKVPIAGLDVQIVSAQGAVLKAPLAGAGAPNPLCSDFTPHDPDGTENINSVGSVVSLGRFRMLDLGDLTWNTERELVCPNNMLGMIDVYLTTHHGLNLSGPPVLVHAVRPRVIVMNNGPRKGGSRETWMTIKSSPGVEDIWQLHYSVQRPGNKMFYETGEVGGKDSNAPEQFIANLDEAAAHTSVYFLKISARPDGSFVVLSSRTGFSKEYKRAKK